MLLGVGAHAPQHVGEGGDVEDALERSAFVDHGDGFYSVTLHYGFMEDVDVPAAADVPVFAVDAVRGPGVFESLKAISKTKIQDFSISPMLGATVQGAGLGFRF